MISPPNRTRVATELFTRVPGGWDAIKNDVVRLERQAFGAGAFAADYLEAEFTDPDNVVVLLHEEETGAVIGFTCAAPLVFLVSDGEFEQRAEPVEVLEETAYIIDTVIHADYRGRGLVGEMMRVLETELRRQGYRFLERDAAVAHDYAAKIGRAYRDRIVFQSEPHDSEWGPQVAFRIRLDRDAGCR